MNNVIQMYLERETISGYRPRVEVYLLKNNNIILGKGKNSQGKEFLTFPGGGVDEHESIEDAATREVLEELAIRIKNIKEIHEPMTFNWDLEKDKMPIKWNWTTKHPYGFITYFRLAEYDEYDDMLFGTEPDQYEVVEVSLNEAISLWEEKQKTGLEPWLLKQTSVQHETMCRIRDGKIPSPIHQLQ